MKLPIGQASLLKMVGPMVDKFLTRDNLAQVFDELTKDADLDQGERAVLIANRDSRGEVMVGVYAVDGDRHITRRYNVMSVEELVITYLKNQ